MVGSVASQLARAQMVKVACIQLQGCDLVSPVSVCTLRAARSCGRLANGRLVACCQPTVSSYAAFGLPVIKVGGAYSFQTKTFVLTVCVPLIVFECIYLDYIIV